MKKHLPFLVAVIALSFALAIDALAEAKRFWIGDVSPADLPKQTYDKYVWEKFEAPDPTGQKWWPIRTEDFSPDEVLLVRFNSFADEKIPPQFEYRIYTKLPPKPPIAGPSSTDPDAQPRCNDCHGGFSPPGGGAKAPAKEPEKGSGGSGSEKGSGGAGSEKGSGGSGSEKGSGGMGSDDPPKADPSKPKNDKEKEKELKKLTSNLAKGVNPWSVGAKIASADPSIYGEKYVGDVIPFNSYYTVPLGGDSKRSPAWLYLEPYRELTPGGEPTGPTLVRVLLLSNKKK